MALVALPLRHITIVGSSGFTGGRRFIETRVSDTLINACRDEIGEHKFIRSDQHIDHGSGEAPYRVSGWWLEVSGWWLEASDDDVAFVMLKYF